MESNEKMWNSSNSNFSISGIFTYLLTSILAVFTFTLSFIFSGFTSAQAYPKSFKKQIRHAKKALKRRFRGISEYLPFSGVTGTKVQKRKLRSSQYKKNANFITETMLSGDPEERLLASSTGGGGYSCLTEGEKRIL